MAARDDFLSRVVAAENRDAAAVAKQQRRCSKPVRSSEKRPRASSPSAARVAAAKASSSSSVAASNKKAFVAAQKESFSVTNQPKLKHGNVATDLRRFNFSVLGPIAAGAYSTIVRARHLSSKREVAIKTFAKCVGKQAEEHERELRVLRLVSEGEGHPNVATLLEEYESPQGATHAVLVYCSGGSLNMLLGKLRRTKTSMRERAAAAVVAQVAKALAHLHSLGVAHRDIKPANILHDGAKWCALMRRKGANVAPIHTPADSGGGPQHSYARA